METLKLGDLVQFRCTGFNVIVSGALMNNIDVTFFLKNPQKVSNWINSLLALSAESAAPITEQAIRDAGIPTLNMNNLIAFGNSPLKSPVLDHLSTDEIRELNDMSLTILIYVVEQNTWRPTVQEMVHALGLDGLEAKVCFQFVNEVTQVDSRTLAPASKAEVERVVAKIVQFHREKQTREIELLPLCAKIEEGIWLTKQALDNKQTEDLDLTITTTQLLEVTEKIFDLYDLVKKRGDGMLRPMKHPFPQNRARSVVLI